MIKDNTTSRPALFIFILLLGLAAYLYFFTEYDVSWPGFFAMLVFYVLIFYIGTYAASLRKNDDVNSILLAGRQLPLFIAVFTMSATWIGGGFINGTAEYTYDKNYGLIWVQAPWGYALSLFAGGLFFARKMRNYGFKTMLDPLTQRFGKRMAILLFIPALSGEIFWTSAILTALGTTFGVVLGLELQPAIVISAFIAIAYTALGGLWAVALTDVVQLILLTVGLLVILPYAGQHVGGINSAWEKYSLQMGSRATLLPSKDVLGEYYWMWWDYALLLIFGGIPWQVYFQRVLAAKSAGVAVRLSFFAGFICLLVAIPASIIGIIGSVTDWTDLGLPLPDQPAIILPHVMRYLTPTAIGTIGLGAIAAAVMSSVDSSILSAASMSGWNVYRPLFKPDISSENLGKVISRCIWIIGIAATLIALNITSVYKLWFLCSDFVYCLLFPALLCALFDPKSNVWGAASGFFVAVILRFGGGDETLGIEPFIQYPMIRGDEVLFPFRTFAMLIGLFTILIVSRLTQNISPPLALVKSD
ncbi:MAG TPA: sodium:solute symporter family protein [Saprospiraceae bacterium]|nr:sodium:solute symporter family protein [Saprospiraceae bacterium]